MASLFGITSAKYQYAIDEYYRIKKEVCEPFIYIVSKYSWLLKQNNLCVSDID